MHNQTSDFDFNIILSNSQTLTQFILDPSSLNLTNRISYSFPNLACFFKISREFCFSIKEIRSSLCLCLYSVYLWPNLHLAESMLLEIRVNCSVVYPIHPQLMQLSHKTMKLFRPRLEDMHILTGWAIALLPPLWYKVK